MATAGINVDTYQEPVLSPAAYGDGDAAGKEFPPLPDSDAYYLFRAAIEEPDDDDYLKKMEGYHRPDRSTESAAIEKLTCARRRYRRSLFSSVHILRKSVELLQEAVSNERRFDYVVEVSVWDKALIKKVTAYIRKVVSETLEKLAQYERYRTAIEEAGKTRREQRMIRRRMTRCLHGAAKRIERSRLRTEWPEALMNEVDETLAYILAAESEPADGINLEDEIGVLREDLVESDGKIRRRIGDAEWHRARYAEVKKNVAEFFIPTLRTAVARFRGRGLSRSELFQEGSLGLMRAVEKVTDARENPLHYFSFWIHQAIENALARMENRQSNQPAMHDIEGIDVIDDDSEQDPVAVAQRNEFSGPLLAAHNKLPIRQREVLALRYGIRVDYEYTLEETGIATRQNRETVRLTEQDGLTSLRNHFPELEIFCDGGGDITVQNKEPLPSEFCTVGGAAHETGVPREFIQELAAAGIITLQEKITKSGLPSRNSQSVGRKLFPLIVGEWEKRKKEKAAKRDRLKTHGRKAHGPDTPPAPATSLDAREA